MCYSNVKLIVMFQNATRVQNRAITIEFPLDGSLCF